MDKKGVPTFQSCPPHLVQVIQPDAHVIQILGVLHGTRGTNSCGCQKSGAQLVERQVFLLGQVQRHPEQATGQYIWGVASIMENFSNWL